MASKEMAPSRKRKPKPQAETSPGTTPLKKKRRAPKSQVTTENSGISHLRDLGTTNKKKHGLSENTQGQYDGYIGLGRKWLASVVEQRLSKPGNSADDGIDTKIFAHAFDDKPNQYSAQALDFILVYNCYERNLKQGTGWKYYSAFKDLWKRNGYNSKQYSVDEKTGLVSGNPADSPDVQSLIESIKHRDRKNGSAATRDHAEAITIEELEAIITYSQAVVSDEVVEMGIKGLLNEEWTKRAMKHAEMRAFFTTGFVLWTRNFELCQLKRSDINWNCRTEPPLSSRYFSIFLENRKGWQNKSEYDSSRESNTYHIYEFTHDPPVLNVYKTLPLWVRLLESRLKRVLHDDELIFPALSVSGQPQTTLPMSQNIIQAEIDQFTQAAGLKRRLTTHSLRRGGAQYRFIHAPWGNRWSLRKVRWWGGWAEGENVETLMKYLLDTLSSYEENYSDAMDPYRLNRADHFMGEQHASSPVTHDMLQVVTHNLGDIFGTALRNATCPPITPHTIPTVNFLPSQQYPQHFRIEPQIPGSKEFTPPSGQLPLYPTATTSQTTSFRPLLGSKFRAEEEESSASAIISKLPRKNGEAWKAAIKQWHEKDPHTGKALKEWPHNWYKGRDHNLNGVKRGQRKCVALEYAKAESNDDEFLKRYPEAAHSFTQLLVAIRKRRKDHAITPAAAEFSDDED